MKYTLKLITLLAVIALAGCASNSDLEAMKAQVQQANETADMALSTANSAKAEARNANETAQAAKAASEAAENKLEYMTKSQTPKRK